MKTLKKKWLTACFGLSVLTGLLLFGRPKAEAQVTVSFQVFYDQMAPFGTWVDYPNYGYVWVPSAGAGFRPYSTRGHWVYCDEGWTWVSDYSWGWAAFHYGNWFYDDTYGWIWVPGYEWAPAWVTWGEYGDDYCWAPIGPRIDIGVAFSTYRPPYGYWSFCPREHITAVNVSHYYVNVHNTTVVNHITVINNINRGGGRGAYVRGPAPANVERFTHSAIRPVSIQASARPGAASVQHGQLAIYRPTVRNFNAGVRPSNVRDLHSLRPVHANAGAAPVAHAQGRPAVNQPPGQPASVHAQHGTPVQRQTPQPQHPVQRPSVVQHRAPQPQHQQQAPVVRHVQPQPQHPAPVVRHVQPQPRPMQPLHQAPPHPVRPMGAPVVRNPQPQPQGNPHDHHR